MKSHHVNLRSGLRVHYIEAGDPSRPALLLLHGFPTDARLWRHCLVPLAEDWHVIAPDLPGHGRSDGQPDAEHDLDYYVAWLGAFYDALGLGRPHLVAHDIGGILALGFAGRHPERVDRFVLMDTAPYANWHWSMRLALELVCWAPLRRLVLTRRGFRWILWRFTTRRQDVLERLVNVFHPSWTATRLRRRMFGEVSRMPPERICPTPGDLARISAPTLLLWAEADPIFPTGIARRLRRDLADAELVTVPGCGHFVPEEEPGLVVDQVRRFLSAPRERATRTDAAGVEALGRVALG
jgi:pimeloyl-ACP methyl ester carboxylesterase